MNIDKHVAQLKNADAAGLEQYERKLRNNAGNEGILTDLFCEGRAALMFLHKGWQVTLRDSPDLQIILDGEVAYAEVKRFRQKKQDKLNEQAMSDAPDGMLVRLGDPTETEGSHAWEQIAKVAIEKASQYKEGFANILVVESDSECLDLMLCSAVREYDETVFGSSHDSPLRRLSGIMLVDKDRISFGPTHYNVEFCQTQHAAAPLTERLATALNNIRLER